MTTNKKAVVITSQAFSLINFRKEILQKMCDKGLEVYALAPDFTSADKNNLLDLGVTPVDTKIERVSLGPIRAFIELYDLTKKIKKIDADISLCYFAKPVVIGNIAAMMSGVKARFSIIEGLGNSRTSIENSFVYKLLFIAAYKIALFGSNKIFFTNKEDLSFFLTKKLINKNQSVYWGGIGVNLKYWSCDKTVIAQDKPLKFIMSTRLLKSKGVLIYLKAAESIKRKLPNVEFILIGGFDDNPSSVSEGDLYYYVNKEIVDWSGNVNNVKEYLCNSDVFVLPSYYGEGVPRSIQEAMACSMPIITTDWVGCRETVNDKENGILIPIKNVDALVDAMFYYINNRKFIGVHGSKSRKMACEMYDVDAKTAFIVGHIVK
jgi:glycosyltransferase involved in cell wall biosynthesis